MRINLYPAILKYGVFIIWTYKCGTVSLRRISFLDTFPLLFWNFLFRLIDNHGQMSFKIF